MKDISYRELPWQFSKDGFEWSQQERQGDLVLYRQGNLHWVVAIVQKHPEVEIKGHRVPAREALPRTEQWGQKAWTYLTEHEARAKFEDLKNGS